MLKNQVNSHHNKNMLLVTNLMLLREQIPLIHVL